MNTTEEQLLAQIWERPDDRAALSVYADWLVEQGRTERGQYMLIKTLKRLSVPDWLEPEHRSQLQAAMAGREIAFRRENRPFPMDLQPVG